MKFMSDGALLRIVKRPAAGTQFSRMAAGCLRVRF